MDQDMDPNTIINQLQAQVQELTQQLQQVIAAQGSAQPAQPVQVPATTTTPTLKIAAPDPFDGDRTKALVFLSQVALYLQSKPPGTFTDQQSILFALSYMKGKRAGEWASRIVQWQLESHES